mmetsp:Transcript_20161/g.27244  ORF Transcript_20161/g.27244 Transcript_20161/m.27244 type:complete len:84 (+) Transcript_20161:1829-2080(+)
MLPHLLYVFSSLVFMKLTLDAQTEGVSAPIWGLLIMISQWAYQAYIELRSILQEGIQYFKRGWNYIDLTGLSFVLMVVLSNLS